MLLFTSLPTYAKELCKMDFIGRRPSHAWQINKEKPHKSPSEKIDCMVKTSLCTTRYLISLQRTGESKQFLVPLDGWSKEPSGVSFNDEKSRRTLRIANKLLGGVTAIINDTGQSRFGCSIGWWSKWFQRVMEHQSTHQVKQYKRKTMRSYVVNVKNHPYLIRSLLNCALEFRTEWFPRKKTFCDVHSVTYPNMSSILSRKNQTNLDSFNAWAVHEIKNNWGSAGKSDDIRIRTRNKLRV